MSGRLDTDMVRINEQAGVLELSPDKVREMKGFARQVGASKMNDALGVLMDRMEVLLSGSPDAEQSVREGRAPTSLRHIFQDAAEKQGPDTLRVAINPAQMERLKGIHEKLVKSGILGAEATNSDAFTYTLKAVQDVGREMQKNHGEIPSRGVSRGLKSLGLA